MRPGVDVVGDELDVQAVSKRYGEVVALRDLSFTVHPGELFGFVGSNGSGKTTTMRIALGVLAADSGQVLLSGRPVDLDARRRIGYMPEQRGLYPKMQVGRQLAYLARLHGLTSAEADDAVVRWSTRLDFAHRLTATVSALSLGNQQRVQLAAALVHDPTLLVLDEPFSGLDPVAVDVMSEVLREKCAAGVPVLFSSHQLELVERLCHRVGILKAGHMQALGTVGELRAGGARQLHVHVPDAPPGWADQVPATRTLSHVDGHTVLQLGPGADDQAVLAAALRTGPVHSFVVQQPSLTELFREAVAA